jgi:glycosyltransferase involved in cell wall biosynthesis
VSPSRALDFGRPVPDDSRVTAETTPRVAIAHEWMVRYAGSERCVDELVRAFPSARLLTTLSVPGALPPALAPAETSFLQHVPGASSHHEWLLPLMPLAWRTMPVLGDVDAVIVSSHACAKAVRVAPGIPVLCYCYTPMRYAWDFAAERGRFPRGTRTAARGLMVGFRRWDRRSASRVTRFVSISRAIAERVLRVYGRRSSVVHPPVRTDFFTPGGERGADFLYVGRLVAYKRADLVVEAFRDLPHRLTVVGEGAMLPALRERATPNVRFLRQIDDARLRDLYRASRALVYPADEDFGIVMAEAQACGAPVVGADLGGARDIVVPGTTGWLIGRQEVAELRAAVRRAARTDLDPVAIRRHAEGFSAESFRRRMRAEVQALIDDPRPR